MIATVAGLIVEDERAKDWRETKGFLIYSLAGALLDRLAAIT